jgi:FixJ family two-component response regulator
MEMLASAAATRIRRRILLVEDDAAVRRSLQLLLTGAGYDVRSYARPAGLAADPEALRTECLVADLVIPDGDGFVLLQDLRAGGWKGAAILISGYLTDESKARAYAQGFDAVFEKPLVESSLTACIERLLQPRRG